MAFNNIQSGHNVFVITRDVHDVEFAKNYMVTEATKATIKVNGEFFDRYSGMSLKKGSMDYLSRTVPPGVRRLGSNLHTRTNMHNSHLYRKKQEVEWQVWAGQLWALAVEGGVRRHIGAPDNHIADWDRGCTPEEVMKDLFTGEGKYNGSYEKHPHTEGRGKKASRWKRPVQAHTGVKDTNKFSGSSSHSKPATTHNKSKKKIETRGKGTGGKDKADGNFYCSDGEFSYFRLGQASEELDKLFVRLRRDRGTPDYRKHVESSAEYDASGTCINIMFRQINVLNDWWIRSTLPQFNWEKYSYIVMTPEQFRVIHDANWDDNNHTTNVEYKFKNCHTWGPVIQPRWNFETSDYRIKK